MTRLLNCDDRDALYQAVRSDLRFLGAIGDALRTTRFTTAEVLGARYRAELQLLGDLGWEPDDARERFEPTVPDDQLARALLRLVNHTTLEALDRPLGATENDPEAKASAARNKRIVAICGELLQHLPPDIVATADEPLPEGWPGR